MFLLLTYHSVWFACKHSPKKACFSTKCADIFHISPRERRKIHVLCEYTLLPGAMYIKGLNENNQSDPRFLTFDVNQGSEFLKGWMHLVGFLPFVHGRQLQWLPVCLPAHQSPSEKGPTLKGKNLFPRGAYSFFFRIYPFNHCPAEPGYTLPWQTVLIEISWLLKMPTDLKQHCLPFSMWIYINNLDQGIWLADN